MADDSQLADFLDKVYADPEFRKKPFPVKIEILGGYDPEFKKLSPKAQAEVIQHKMYQTPMQPKGFWQRLGMAVEPVGRAEEEALQGIGAGAISTGMHTADLAARGYSWATGKEDPHLLEKPLVQKLITPPPSTAGQLGFRGEQMAEYFLPIAPEIKGATKLARAARIAREGARGGVIGGMQTGTGEGATIGGVLGAGGAALGETAQILAPKLYEKALGYLPKKMRFRQREELVERGLKPGQEIPVTKPELQPGGREVVPRLDEEVARHKATIDQLTKSHPVYSQRTLDIRRVLKPVDDYIKRLARVDKRAAGGLARRRLEWAKELGYVPATPATPAKQVATGLLDAKGNPIMRTIPGKPGTPAVTTTTVETVQRLKEVFREAIPESARGAHPAQPLAESAQTAGRKLAERGMKRSIEKAIPEKAIQEINHVIETDLRLKEAIINAVKRKPGWLAEAAPFIVGGGSVGVLNLLDAEKHPHMTDAARIAAAAGFLTSLITRTPGGLSRLAIVLQRSGVAMPKLLPGAAAAARPPTVGLEQLADDRFGKKFSQLEPGQQEQVRKMFRDMQAHPFAELFEEGGGKGEAGTSADVSQEDLLGMIDDAAKRHGVPPKLLHAVARAESSLDPDAESDKGAIGIMQLTPDTAKRFHVENIRDPRQNIDGGAANLAYLIGKYGENNLPAVLAAYNAGEAPVDKAGGQVPNYPETQQYVKRVQALLEQQ
jgi:hypothetical protein